MAKKKFSDESGLQSIVDGAWKKYQKANATKKTVKRAAKKPVKSRKK